MCCVFMCMHEANMIEWQSTVIWFTQLSLLWLEFKLIGQSSDYNVSFYLKISVGREHSIQNKTIYVLSHLLSYIYTFECDLLVLILIWLIIFVYLGKTSVVSFWGPDLMSEHWAMRCFHMVVRSIQDISPKGHCPLVWLYFLLMLQFTFTLELLYGKAFLKI